MSNRYLFKRFHVRLKSLPKKGSINNLNKIIRIKSQEVSLDFGLRLFLIHKSLLRFLELMFYSKPHWRGKHLLGMFLITYTFLSWWAASVVRKCCNKHVFFPSLPLSSSCRPPFCPDGVFFYELYLLLLVSGESRGLKCFEDCELFLVLQSTTTPSLECVKPKEK